MLKISFLLNKNGTNKTDNRSDNSKNNNNQSNNKKVKK